MVDTDQRHRADARRKLTGWKSIGRHLGRSPRAVQLWERERGLPIHRIPGGTGQTVFAFAEELDAWMVLGADYKKHEASVASAIEPMDAVRTSAVPLAPVRPPGILVLPFENHDLANPTSFGDSICQHLIERLAESQGSVRVLSWQTSKNSRQWVGPLHAMSSTLQVRYLVEGSVDCSHGIKHVDVRIIDAELDQVVLADRFSSLHDGTANFPEDVAEAVATHFALIHEGALVEPMCLAEIAPVTMLDYLRGVRHFYEDQTSAIDVAVESLERALTRDAGFTPARAMMGLVLLQAAGNDQRSMPCTERIRSIASICNASTSARVTTAFLDAAIAIVCDRDLVLAEKQVSRVLRWLPHSIASRGRLYERRSPLRPRAEDLAPSSSPRRQLAKTSRVNIDVFASLLCMIAGVGRTHPARDIPLQ